MARKRRCRQNGPREKAVLIRVDDDEKRMIQDAARRRGQTVSLTVIEAVKLLEGSLYVEEEEHDSPTVQALRDIEYQQPGYGYQPGFQQPQQWQQQPWN